MTIEQLGNDRYKALDRIHKENGIEITTGVFEQNDLEFINEEIDNAIDLEYVEHLAQCQDRDCIDRDHDYWENQEPAYLIGFRYNETTEEYDPDPAAEYSAIWSGTTIQVVKSEWYIRGGLCSPCFPGQVDATTDGDILAYSIPPDVIGYTDPTDYEEAEALRGRIFAATISTLATEKPISRYLPEQATDQTITHPCRDH